MNDDLLKKLLAQDQADYSVPQSKDEALPIDQEMNLRKLNPLDFTNEPPDRIAPNPLPAKVSPGLPFTKKESSALDNLKNAPDQNDAELSLNNVPAEPKKPVSLADILAGMKPTQNSDLQDAQSSSNNDIRNLLMMRGANTMAQGLVLQKPDPNFLSDNIVLARQGVQDIKDKQKADIDQREQFNKDKNQVITDQRAISELGNLSKEQDANSDLSKSTRSMLQSQVDAAKLPITIDPNMSYSHLVKLYPQAINQALAKMGEDSKSKDLAYKYEALNQINKDKNESKMSAVNNKQFDNFSKAVDYRNKSSRTAGGKIMTALDVSDRLSGLINKNPNDMTSQEMRELVTGVNTLIGGSQAVSQIEHMDYPTLARTYSEMSTKITGKPQPMNSPEVVNRLKSLIDREHGILAGQLKKDMDIQKKRFPSLENDDRVNALYSEILGSSPSDSKETNVLPDPRIDKFMKDNNIKDRNEAISILKKEGHL